MSEPSNLNARLSLQPLEDRSMPAVMPILLADPQVNAMLQRPAGSTPVLERVTNTGHAGMKWRCNAYSSTHAHPGECSDPSKGGVWVADPNAKPTRPTTTTKYTSPSLGYSGGPTTHWYGNFLGPGNAGWNSKPVNSLDAGARTHDIAYDFAGANGAWGALTNRSVSGDDWALAATAWDAFNNNRSLGAWDRVLALGTAGVFGGLGFGKEYVNTAPGVIKAGYNAGVNGVTSAYNALTGGIKSAYNGVTNSLNNAANNLSNLLAPLNYQGSWRLPF